ncbi:30S ribosome-binding factor RbfA [Desulfoluna spongiiphila]|uniref:Ribosome-binding factor A n=1 Tax=Desulfoluna spongiiphila TaxID=419481 RepID=A0A1G5GQX9_9BACT|nr:30S ribosome-binding factor RbfA [Desulfoluna spongiiphila]SCY53068.1 ribosome-binding factor A [Desulfoluna spongiiphila]VVS92803.1 ribosome-binding factor a [Desulfoluna spongiiphila]
MKPFSRAERVSVKIQSTLSELLHKKVSDPRLEMATVTGVKLTDDLRHAQVFFCVSGGKKAKYEALAGFKSASGFLRKSLAGKLGLKFMPALTFVYDESLDYGSHINEVLKSLSVDGDSDTEGESDS